MSISRIHLIVAGVVTLGIVALAGLFLFAPSGGQDITLIQGEDQATSSASSANTTTDHSSSTSTLPKKQLPPEPVFALPEGAIAIDEYAYVDKGVVYFRSFVDNQKPLIIQAASPSTFRRLEDFFTYPGSAIVRDCGAAPIYTFYVDARRPYFYQVWRTPDYRASRVDVMNGADVKNFKITSLTSATDGKIRFDIGYKLGTSTCRLILNQAVL